MPLWAALGLGSGGHQRGQRGEGMGNRCGQPASQLRIQAASINSLIKAVPIDSHVGLDSCSAHFKFLVNGVN